MGEFQVGKMGHQPSTSSKNPGKLPLDDDSIMEFIDIKVERLPIGIKLPAGAGVNGTALTISGFDNDHAKEAGFQVHDEIVAVEFIQVTSREMFQKVFKEVKDKLPVTFTVRRKVRAVQGRRISAITGQQLDKE